MKRLAEIEALLILIGAVIGVGMFGIPYAAVQAGLVVTMAELLLLAGAVSVVHLAYAEVALRTRGAHTLPGYAARYLGPGAGRIAAFAFVAGLSGSLLAFLLLGGPFFGELLSTLLPVVNPQWGTALFWGLGVGIMASGQRTESWTSAVLSIVLVAALVGMLVPLLERMHLALLPAARPSEMALPYGVLLFSLYGASVMPYLVRMLTPRRRRRIGLVILGGTLLPAVFYGLFALGVAGVTGPSTTADAMTGLGRQFGPLYLLLGSAVGFLAAITSFIPLGATLASTFRDDFGLPARLSLVLVAAIPVGLVALGFQNFLRTVGAVGALSIGLESVFIIAMHRASRRRGDRRPEFSIALPEWLAGALHAMFIFGMLVYVFVRP